MAAIPSKTWSKRGRRWRRLLERLVPDRLRDALAGPASVDEDLLLPLDRGLARWDEPELLRGRGGADARVAMLGRLQDQWPDGRDPRRAQLGSARRCRKAKAQDLKWSDPAGASHTAPSTKTAGRSSSAVPTAPTTSQPAGTASGAGKVAARAWSSPPVKTKLYGSAPVAAATAWSGSASSKAFRLRSISTCEARATWPRSASRPSEMSIMEVAPARAASAPAP